MSKGGASGGGGTRAFAPRFRAVGQAIPGQDIEPLCNDLLRRMRWIRRKTSAGVYLLGDSDGYVYILHEQACFSERAVKQLQRMVIGMYASGPLLVYPTPGQLCEDLISHFIEVGLIEIPSIFVAKG